MSYTLAIIFSFSIAIPAIIGWIRIKKINPAYYPFLFCIWIGFLNEIISYIITHRGYSDVMNNNIYALLESLLITWQFKKWRLFERVKYFFPVILFSFILFWIFESLLIKGVTLNISYFRIFYSFVIVLMSVNIINKQLMRDKRNILRNSIFLICTTFVIYYIYTVIVGMFWLYGLSFSNQFMINIVTILLSINLFTNLMFALAVLWIPTKHRFLLPS